MKVYEKHTLLIRSRQPDAESVLPRCVLILAGFHPEPFKQITVQSKGGLLLWCNCRIHIKTYDSVQMNNTLLAHTNITQNFYTTADTELCR